MAKYMQMPGAPALPGDDSKRFNELDELFSKTDAGVRHQIASAIGTQCINALENAVTLPEMVRAINGAQTTMEMIEKHMTDSRVITAIRSKLEDFFQRGERAKEDMTELYDLFLDENAGEDEAEKVMIRMELRNQHYGYAAHRVMRLKRMPPEKKMEVVKDLFQKALVSKKMTEIASALDAMEDLGLLAKPAAFLSGMLRDLNKENDWKGYNDLIEHYRLRTGRNEEGKRAALMLKTCFRELTDHLGTGRDNKAGSLEETLTVLHLTERILIDDFAHQSHPDVHAVEPGKESIRLLLDTIKDAIRQLSAKKHRKKSKGAGPGTSPESADDEMFNNDRIRDLYGLALKLIFRFHDGDDENVVKAEWARDYRKWCASTRHDHYDDLLAHFEDRDGKSTNLLACEHKKWPKATATLINRSFDLEFDRFTLQVEKGHADSTHKMLALSEIMEQCGIDPNYENLKDLIDFVFKTHNADLHMQMLNVILEKKEKLYDDWDWIGPALFNRYLDHYRQNRQNPETADRVRSTLVWMGNIMQDHSAPGADEVVCVAREEMHKTLAPKAFTEGFTQSFHVKQALGNISRLLAAGGSVPVEEETALWKIYTEDLLESAIARKLYAAVKISQTDPNLADETAQKAFDAYVGRVLELGRKTKDQIIADLLSMEVLEGQNGELFLEEVETWERAKYLLKGLCERNGGHHSTVN